MVEDQPFKPKDGGLESCQVPDLQVLHQWLLLDFNVVKALWRSGCALTFQLKVWVIVPPDNGLSNISCASSIALQHC